MDVQPVAQESLTLEQASAVERKRRRKRHITIFAVVSLVNVGLLVVLWVALLTPASNTGQINQNNDLAGLGDVSSPLIGKSAPDFTLNTLNGAATKLHLADLRGKVVVLNFWQSACDPCAEEAPFMQKMWLQAQAKGVVFVGIDVADTSDGAHAFLKKYGVTYANVQDTLTTATGLNYGITGYPETFFIDAGGMVVARWIKPLDAQGMQLELQKLNIHL